MTGDAVTDTFVKHHLVFIVKRKWLVMLELPCKRRVEAETQSRSCFAAAHLHFLQLQFTAANNHGAARPWLCHCLIECVYTWVSEAPGGNQPPNPADVSATEPHRTTSLLKNALLLYQPRFCANAALLLLNVFVFDIAPLCDRSINTIWKYCR